MGTMRAFHPPLGLRRTGRDNAKAQLAAHAPELGHGGFSAPPLLRVGRPHVHVLPVGVERPRYPVAFDPAAQHPGRRPDRFLLGESAQRRSGGVVHHVHQTAARSCHAAGPSLPPPDTAPRSVWLADNSAPATGWLLPAASCPPSLSPSPPPDSAPGCSIPSSPIGVPPVGGTLSGDISNVVARGHFYCGSTAARVVTAF